MEGLNFKDLEELNLYLQYIHNIKSVTKSEKMQTFYGRIEHDLIEKIIDLKNKPIS